MPNPKSLVAFKVIRSKIRSNLRSNSLLPAYGDRGGQQYFDDFRKNKPVQPKANRQRNRVRKHGEPTKTAGEKHEFRGQG